MASEAIEEIVKSLVLASSEVVPVSGREAWPYGWSFADYRHSGKAALPGGSDPVALTENGIAAFETAMVKLLRDQPMRSRWKSEELWGVIGSLIVGASTKADRARMIKRNIDRLRTAGPALIVALIANVVWGSGSPIILDDSVIGIAGQELIDAINGNSGDRRGIDDKTAAAWLSAQVNSRGTRPGGPRPVAMACWTVGQGELATDEFARRLQDLLDLTMLLERDLGRHKVYRRGDANRPGIRGLTLDRGAIERHVGSSGQIELGTEFVIITDIKTGGAAHWYGTEPFPLGKLLRQKYLEKAVRSCLVNDPISGRIRVAARWFAECFYSLAEDDATLALGVAMDALVSGQRALPGSVMADRFALLSDDAAVRRALVREYLDLFGVRSSVVHGGRSSKLDEEGFVERYMEAVHWAAWRSLALRNEFAPKSEADVDSLFDDLRWGVRAWPRRAGGRLYGRTRVPSAPRSVVAAAT